jgi:hypothetical protein
MPTSSRRSSHDSNPMPGGRMRRRCPDC